MNKMKTNQLSSSLDKKNWRKKERQADQKETREIKPEKYAEQINQNEAGEKSWRKIPRKLSKKETHHKDKNNQRQTVTVQSSFQGPLLMTTVLLRRLRKQDMPQASTPSLRGSGFKVRPWLDVTRS